MILTINRFRNLLSRYEKFVPSEPTWNDYWSSGMKDGKTISSLPKKPTPQEDVFVRELIDSVDFYTLYSSIEFRKALRKRLKYYEGEKI